jgi:acetyl esterase/lipase
MPSPRDRAELAPTRQICDGTASPHPTRRPEEWIMGETIDGGTDEGALRLPSREIAVPESVSAEAQAMLRMMGPIATHQLEHPHLMPEPGDVEGWREFVRVSDEMILASFPARGVPLDAVAEPCDLGGVPGFEVRPEGVDCGPDAPVYLDIHGGALLMGGGEVCRLMSVGSSATTRLHTFGVDYRMPPDHPYPAPLDDCVAAYRALLDRWPADRIAVGGASAGGNLAPALLLRAHDEGLPMPAALVLLTPECDLTESGDTFDVLEGVDVVLVRRLRETAALYADGHDLAHPYLSPLFGDVAHLPPTLIQSGTRDLFLSNSVRMHRALRAAGVEAELHVWEAMPHGGFGNAPEDAEIGREVRTFLAKHLTSV